MTSAEARFSNSLRPRKPEGSLGRTAQDGHLDSHTAPELCPVLARIARDIPTLPNRAQLSHATNLPILTANLRVGEGKVGEGGFFTAAILAVRGLEL